MRKMSKIFELETVFELQKIKNNLKDKEKLKIESNKTKIKIKIYIDRILDDLNNLIEKPENFANFLYDYETKVQNFIGKKIKSILETEKKKKLNAENKEPSVENKEPSVENFDYFFKYFLTPYSHDQSNKIVEHFRNFYEFYLVLHCIYETMYCSVKCKDESVVFLKDIIVKKNRKSLKDLIEYILKNSIFLIDGDVEELFESILFLLSM